MANINWNDLTALEVTSYYLFGKPYGLRPKGDQLLSESFFTQRNELTLSMSGIDNIHNYMTSSSGAGRFSSFPSVLGGNAYSNTNNKINL